MPGEQALILVFLVSSGLLAIMVIGRARQQGAGSKRSPYARQTDGGTTTPIDGGQSNDRGQDSGKDDDGGSSSGGRDSSGGSDSSSGSDGGGGGNDGGGGGGDS